MGPFSDRLNRRTNSPTRLAGKGFQVFPAGKCRMISRTVLNAFQFSLTAADHKPSPADPTAVSTAASQNNDDKMSEQLVSPVIRTIFLILVCGCAGRFAVAQPSDPYHKTLLDFGYQPTGEGARKFLRSLVPSDKSRQATEELLDQLDAADYQTRDEATNRLLAMPDLPFAMLNQAAQSGTAEVRWRARHILRHSQEKGSKLLLASLKIIAQDPPDRAAGDILLVLPYCRQSYQVAAAHQALRQAVTPDDQPLLAQRLTDANPKVRQAAIVGLTQILGGDAAKLFYPLLDDADDQVALTAARAIADAGDRRCFECLLRLLSSADSNVRSESVAMLRMLTQQNFGYVSYETEENRRLAVAQWRQWVAANGSTAELHYPLSARVSARGQLGGNTLVSTGSKGKVMELDPTGKVVWTYDLAAWSAEKLLNGNVLAASYTAKKVVEVDRVGNVVWELDGTSAMTAKPLLNGNFLIADFAGRRVIEVDRAKRTVWQVSTEANCFDADRLPNGNTIFGCPNKIREVTPDGDTVHQWEIPGRLNGFQALDSGNVLVANYGQSKVYELTRGGDIVWELDEPKPCDVFRLDDGHLLVSTANRIVEFGPDKKIVRTLTDARYGSARR